MVRMKNKPKIMLTDKCGSDHSGAQALFQPTPWSHCMTYDTSKLFRLMWLSSSPKVGRTAAQVMGEWGNL
jgi:hypothetical protein